MNKDRVLLGMISAPHGVKGQVKIRSFTAIPDDIAAYGPLQDEKGITSYIVDITGQTQAGLVAWIEGVTTREQAEALKGLKLYIDKNLLPEAEEEEFYYEDLIGLAVITTEGAAFGTVKAVHNFGAGELLEITEEGGNKTDFYAFTKLVFPEIHIKEGRIVISPPDIIIAKDDE